MVYGPVAPTGSTKDSRGRTIVPKKVYGPVAPTGSRKDSRGRTIVPSRGGNSSSRGSSNNKEKYKTGTVGSTTLYYIKDPITGKITVTGSPELASSSYTSGLTVEAGRDYGRSGRSRYDPSTSYDTAAAARIAAEKKAEQARIETARIAAERKAERDRLLQERREKAIAARQQVTTPQDFQERLRQLGQKDLTPEQRKVQDKYFGYSIAKPQPKPKPLSVMAVGVGDTGLDAQRYKQPYWESTKQAFGKLKKGKPLEFFDPFLYSSDIKAKKIAQKETSYFEPQFGTISTDYPTGLKEVKIKEKTYGDIQREKQQSREKEINTEKNKIDIKVNKEFKKLQSDVNSGKVKIEDAQETFNSYVKQLETELDTKAKKIYKKYPDVPGVFERENLVKKYGTVAADIAGYTLANALAGQTGTLAYGAARGIGLVTKKPTKEAAFLDIGEAWGEYLTGKEVTESPMLQKYKGYRSEAGLHLLGAVSSGVEKAGKLGGELNVLRYLEAQKAEPKTIGKIYGVGKEKWIKSVTRKKAPYFESELLVDAPIIQKSKTDFILGASKAKQKVKFLPFTEQVGDKGWRLIEREAIIGAKSKVGPLVFEGIEIPEFFGTYGRGYMQPLKSTKGTSYFDFGGVSQDMGDFLVGKGGKAVSKRVYPELSDDILFSFKKSQKIIEKSVRVSPGQYAKERFGSRFFETELPDDMLGMFMKPTKIGSKKGVLPRIKIQKGLVGKEKQETIAHELIHSKTPEAIYWGDILPYRYRPSELLAYGLEKRVAKKGLKSTAFKVVDISEDLIEIPLKTRLVVKPKDTSIIFKKAPKIKDDFGLIITKVSKKSSKEYLQGLSQIQAQEFATPSFGDFTSTVGEELTKQVGKTITIQPKTIKPIVAYSTMQEPGQKDMLNQFFNINTPFFDPIFEPVSRIKSIAILAPKIKEKVKVKSGSKSKSISTQLYSPALDVGVKSATISKTATKQKTFQRQRLQQSQVFTPAFDLGFNFGGMGGGFGFDFGLPDRQKDRKIKTISKKITSKKKPKKYVARPTAFGLLGRLTSSAAPTKKEFTGFEIFRFTRGRKVKKKPKTKRKIRKDTWGLY